LFLCFLLKELYWHIEQANLKSCQPDNMLYSLFIEQTAPYFEKNKFKFEKGLQGFVTKFEEGEMRFYTILDRSIQVRMSYGIKFKEVDQTFSKIFNIEDKPAYNTIYVNLLNALDNDESHFLITNEDEVQMGVKKTIDVYEQFASAYFQTYNTLQSLNDLLNDQEIYYNKIGNNKYHGDVTESITKGLIVAKILHRKDYDQIERSRLDSLKQKLHPNLYPESENRILKVREFFKRLPI
jgi:hypothetical protein